MSIVAKLRKNWLAQRGYLSPGASNKIPNTSKSREENRQTGQRPAKKPYRPGDKVIHRKGFLK